MTATLAPNLKPDRAESDRPTLRLADTPSAAHAVDATQGRQIGSVPFDDATQGKTIGSDPVDDATRAR